MNILKLYSVVDSDLKVHNQQDFKNIYCGFIIISWTQMFMDYMGSDEPQI